MKKARIAVQLEGKGAVAEELLMATREIGDGVEVHNCVEDGAVAQMQESLSQQCILFPFIMVIPPC